MPKKKKDVIHEGWLLKSPPMKGVWKAASPITTFDSLYTRIFQRWKRRWFVLRQSEGLPDLFLLEYFTDRNCRNMKGGISLDKCEQVDAGFKCDKPNLKDCHLFNIKIQDRLYYLAAETEEEMNKWVDCICHVCGFKVFSSADNTEKSGTRNDNSDEDVEYGPYIPISECITGRSPTTLEELKHFDFRKFHERSESLNLATANDKNVTHSRTSSAIELSNDTKLYDSPRQLQPERRLRCDYDASSHYLNVFHNKRSPIVLNESVSDAENVFNFNLNLKSERNYRKSSRNNSNNVDIKSNKLENSRSSKDSIQLGPVPLPRFPKKEQLNSIKNVAEKSKTDTHDETYDCPRSHVLPKSKSPNIFKYPPETNIPSPRSTSSNSLSPSNSSLPSPFSVTENMVNTPPSVNRDLKPIISPPDVNRKLKPPINYQTTEIENGIKTLRKTRTPSSPVSKSRPSDVKSKNQLNIFEYLDLDLSTDSKKSSSPNRLPLSKSTVDYKTVDFVKTEAFKLTKQSVEAERKMLSFKS